MTIYSSTILLRGITLSILWFAIVATPLTSQVLENDSKKDEISSIENQLINKADKDTSLPYLQRELSNSESQLVDAKSSLKKTEFHVLVLLITLIILSVLALWAFRLIQLRDNTIKEIQKINKDKDHFIGVVSHDLRSPLNAIMMLSSILAEDSKNSTPDEVEEFGSIILNSGKRMEHLIKNMLDTNKIETGNVKLESVPISVKEAIDEVADSVIYLSKEKDIETEIFIEDDLPKILGDFNAIQRIIENLVSNAYKFSPHSSYVLISATKEGSQVQLLVQDQGLGMSELDRGKLFTKFEKLSASPTGNEKSTGLGLYIVKNLVSEMNGTILVESELDKGTTFKVLFNQA